MRSPIGSDETEEDLIPMAKATGSFTGFSEEAFTFLSGLSRNNRKSWFDANRQVYDDAIVAPALAFIEALGAGIQAFAPSVKTDPRIGGSLFRIHRDTRFSADKSPYKTHVGIRFRDGDTATSSKCTGPLFYVEFDVMRLRLGVGVKEFDPQTLAVYRAFVGGTVGVDGVADALNMADRQAGREGTEVLGARLSRLPRGYEDGRLPELLKRKGFFMRTETTLPEVIHSPEFIDYCAEWFRPRVPVFEALRRVALATLERSP